MVGLPSVACPLPGASPLRPGKGGEKPILEKHSKRKHPWRQDPSSPLAGAKLSVNYFAALPEPEGSKNTCGRCCWWVG